MVQYLDESLIEEYLARSRQDPRGRVMLNFHRSFEDAVQRMVNFIQPGSYVMPHRHLDPEKFETFIVLKGEVALFIFDDSGAVSSVTLLGEDGHSVLGDVLPPAWHCYQATKPDTIVFETKQGPYNSDTDKNFAPWAPAEGSPGVSEYLIKLFSFLKTANEG